MLTIGITGGTGCGKTALLRRIEARGGFGIDCDALYYTLLRTDAPLRAALTEAFGEVFLPDGGLDRQRLGACVFSDPAQLERLNQIVFLHVRRAVEALLRREKDAGRALVCIDAINLFQSRLDALCDTTVGVLAPEKTRLARIMARDGIGEEYALLRIRAQAPDAFYRAHCRHILENSGKDPKAFEKQADLLLDNLTKENRT